MVNSRKWKDTTEERRRAEQVGSHSAPSAAGLLGLQASAGNAAGVRMLRQANHPRASEAVVVPILMDVGSTSGTRSGGLAACRA